MHSWNSNCCNDKVISPSLFYRWRAKLLAISICWQSFCFAGSFGHSCNRIRLECHSSPHRCHTLVHLPTTCPPHLTPPPAPVPRRATQALFFHVRTKRNCLKLLLALFVCYSVWIKTKSNTMQWLPKKKAVTTPLLLSHSPSLFPLALPLPVSMQWQTDGTWQAPAFVVYP